jgi:hypothetical protein
MAQNKIIKFSDTFYFEPWKQNTNSIYPQRLATWRKSGHEDDCILLESILHFGDIYWKPHFSTSSNESVWQISRLYWEIHPLQYDFKNDVNEAKNHIDTFLIKASKIAIFI